MEFHSQMDLTMLCRICMRDIAAVVAEDIYEPSDTGQPNLHGMLRVICAPAFSSDEIQNQKAEELYGIPNMVCPDCVQYIMDAFRLHEKCIESDRKFELHSQKDLTLLCRVCMKDTVAVVAEDIYEPSDTDQPNLHGMLSVICAPVFSSDEIQNHNAEESHRMPNMVCHDCVQNIIAAYKLHKKCIESNRKLWEMITLKQELQQDNEMIFVISETNREVAKNGLAQPEIVGSPHDRDAALNSVEDLANTSTIDRTRLQVPDTVSKPTECHANTLSTIEKNHPQDQGTSLNHTEDHMNPQRTIAEPVIASSTEKYDKYRPGIWAGSDAAFTPYKCTKCRSGFSNRHLLDVHLLRHIGKRPFACDQCPARFYTKTSMTTHIKIHSKEKNFACDICDSRFSRKSSVIDHKKCHDNKRPYACKLCDKKFKTPNHLKRHMRTHTGEKPFKCAYCDRAFAQSNDLVKHCRFHVGENTYKCDYCEKSFRLLADLRNHYKVHFQPGDEGEDKARVKLESMYPKGITGADERVFTSMNLLNRRYKQEKKQEQLQEKEDEKNDDEEKDDKEDGGGEEEKEKAEEEKQEQKSKVETRGSKTRSKKKK